MNPIITIIIFFAAIFLSVFLKKEKHIRSVSVVFAMLSSIAVLSLSLPVLLGNIAPWADDVWLVDNFSALMASLVVFVYFMATLVSYRYIGHEYKEKILTLNDLRTYFSLLHVFALCMIVTVLTNNSILLWIALEGTTLSSTFLVGLYRRKTSVEAAWKYIIICSTGISLGLVGILLLGFGLSQAGGSDIFLLTSLFQNSSLIAPDIVKWAFVFLFAGFGAKVGMVPMHTWLPDAHSKAPSPISAMFSGILLNVALYAIIRFKFIADSSMGSSIWTDKLFLFFGVISILLPAFMMLVQNNYKRMLAYSSVEHMGIITFALSLSPMGAIASVIHMIGHTLTKSMLFFGAGEILINYKTTKTEKIANLLRKTPITAVLFLIGILAIIALPPSILFVSEYTLFSNALTIHPIISIFLLLGLSVIAYSMLKSTISMFFEKEKEKDEKVEREKWNITHTVMTLQIVLIVVISFFLSTGSGIDFIDSIVKNFTYKK